MKISRNWLQTFFDTPLPSAAELENLLTFHSSEIEEVIAVGDDTVLDVKVLPDKSAWLLSHRGVAKEISVITGMPLRRDALREVTELTPHAPTLTVTLATPQCDYYSTALVTGVKVGPSPAWLVSRLTAVGQRSINNVVDATNYIMFELGQPLHAFDADKLSSFNNGYHIAVRQAHTDEKITTLTGEAYALDDEVMVITDGGSDTPLAIAGIKGGMVALVDSATTTIIIESAHFDRFSVRSTSKKIKLRTDASARYENGIPSGLAPVALPAVVKLITEIAEGTLVGYSAAGTISHDRIPVCVSLEKINSTLGLTLALTDVEHILRKFGYVYEIAGSTITVTPPWERDDLVVPADVIEEIGRIYGMDKIISILPTPSLLTDYNPRHYYAEKIRHTLLALGFSEIYTSSFRSQDVAHIQNALASDKSYLRSALHTNLREVVIKNVSHRDLLGLMAVKVFEIGTVFGATDEAFHVGLGVQTGTSYKAKVDDVVLGAAQDAIARALGTTVSWQGTDEGVSEFSLDALLPSLPPVTRYDEVQATTLVPYQPFSIYPSVTRDIALWVEVAVEAHAVESLLQKHAGDLCVRVTLFDTFIKEDKTSLAFRLVFQASDRTLVEQDISTVMNNIYQIVTEKGWEVR